MGVTRDDSLYIGFGERAVLIQCQDDETRTYLHDHFSHCAADGSSIVETYRIDREPKGQVHVWRQGDQVYYGSLSPYLIECLMQELTRVLIVYSEHYLAFHAAGLAMGESGVLLCGVSGSGKSTLAAWLTGGGFGFLTDELVGVAPDASWMVGFPRLIGLKTGSMFVADRLLSEDARRDLPRISDKMVLLDPELLRSGCVQPFARPAAIVFPRFEPDAAFAPTRLSAGVSLFRLMQRLLNAKNLPEHGLSWVTLLARRCPAYELVYSDVIPVPDWLGDILALEGLSGGV